MLPNQKLDILEKISSIFNRSHNQEKFLLSLLEDDINLLLDLEVRIKNLHIHYCPSDKEECDKILEMELPEDLWFPPPLFIFK